jgi:hypothetical protein
MTDKKNCLAPSHSQTMEDFDNRTNEKNYLVDWQTEKYYAY